jgi:hypothetical protein
MDAGRLIQSARSTSSETWTLYSLPVVSDFQTRAASSTFLLRQAPAARSAQAVNAIV